MMRIVTGDEELARTIHVDSACSGRRQCAMPQAHKVRAPLIACLRGLEDLVWFHIEKSQAHGSMTHDAFQVATSTATAEFFVRIERDYGVAALPNPFRVRVSSEADSVAKRPNANEPVELTARRGKSRRNDVG